MKGWQVPSPQQSVWPAGQGQSTGQLCTFSYGLVQTQSPHTRGAQYVMETVVWSSFKQPTPSGWLTQTTFDVQLTETPL